jgi:hypothetical protein
MKALLKWMVLLAVLLSASPVTAQVPDSIYNPAILTPRIYPVGDQLALPVYRLGSGDQMELHFDDKDGGVKNYYYTYLLCDYNWQPVALNPFDYIKGFTLQRINTYRFSSIAFTRYTHYSALLPDRNCSPSRSGNYLLKIFRDGDTAKLAFTKRLLVLDNKATVAGQVVQPFAPQLYRTHQKLLYNVNIGGINSFSPAQQIKVVVLQNNRWDNAQWGIPPTFVRGNVLDYNTENSSVFAAGKEWRWLDLRSFRLQSDRVERADYRTNGTDIFLKVDADRNGQKYSYYRDMNGMFSTETFESINPYWQGDYAKVHFRFAPPGGRPYIGRHIFITGLLTNYNNSIANAMRFNDSTGLYEATLFLKQGFYNYGYVLTDVKTGQQYNEIEGNYWEAENIYTILIAFINRKVLIHNFLF